jgi:filamentous hemagglutinin
VGSIKSYNIENDMRNGNCRFKLPEGIIAGYVDKNGKYWVSEGHHRMPAAKEIYQETGDTSNVKTLFKNGL